jgi:hypothetical protein
MLQSFQGKPPSRKPVSLPTQTQYRARSFLMVGNARINFKYAARNARKSSKSSSQSLRQAGAGRQQTWNQGRALRLSRVSIVVWRRHGFSPFPNGNSSWTGTKNSRLRKRQRRMKRPHHQYRGGNSLGSSPRSNRRRASRTTGVGIRSTSTLPKPYCFTIR